MGNCKRDNCVGTLRRDGSCSQEGCVLHRPSLRGQCWKWISKATKKLRTPLKLKRPKTRHHQKAPVATTPKTTRTQPSTPPTATTPACISIHTSPTETTLNTPSAAFEAESFNVDFDVLDNALVPEAHVRLLRNCFRFRAPSPDDNDSNLLLAPTGVNSLGLAVAAHYDTILGEKGEPRTLSVFSGISGILQKIPSGPTFSPQHLYVAACFYLGWELAGSWAQKEPTIIANANHSDVKRCALEL